MPWKQFCASLVLCLICGQAAFALPSEDKPLYGRVPEFAFTERSGRQVQLADLEGEVWIADFIFTRCQGMCPLITGKMAGLQERLKDSGVTLVSFSVDPDYDTPQVLAEYALRYGAKEDTWFFLTGEKQTMWDFITEGFSLGVQEASPEDLKAGAEPVMHSSRFVLIDQKGRIRGYYDSSEPQKMDELVRDALSLTS